MLCKFIKYNGIITTVFSLLLVLILIIGQGSTSALAATSNYSDVLTDLQKDESFDPTAYPEKPKDYSVNVIQIAESENGELFVYTYQPSGYLLATEINMSLTDKMGGKLDNGEELSPSDSPKLYKLELLNSDSVFCKYKVVDFNVSRDNIRYYNIASIYRDYIYGIDKPTGNDNTINSVSFKVGKLYVAITDNGTVKYYCTEREVIAVTEKYVGFMRYTEGYWLWRDACDSHYVAFSTDWEMDYLYEAELTYFSRSVRHTKTDYFTEKDEYKYGDDTEQPPVILSEFDTGHTTVTGIGGIKHTWSRIQSVSKFKETEEVTDEVLNELKGKQWVLRFADTDYTRYIERDPFGTSVIGYSDYYTEVSNVTILRLKFEKNGEVYNLGVVDNRQTGGDKPSNPQPNDPKDDNDGFWSYVWNCLVKLFTGKASVWETVVAVLTFVVVVVAVVLVIKFIKFVIRGLFK